MWRVLLLVSSILVVSGVALLAIGPEISFLGLARSPDDLRTMIPGLSLIVVGLLVLLIPANEKPLDYLRNNSRATAGADSTTTIHFSCPSCGKIYNAPSSLVGTQFHCRMCKQAFEVRINQA